MGTTAYGSAPASSFEHVLPPQSTSVAEARRLVRSLLASSREAGRAANAALADTAAVVVSELVTNALLHAGTPIVLAGRIEEDRRLRLEVEDGGRHLPVPRHYASTAGTGRGLRLIEELSEAWGVEQHARGKTVWCVVSDGAAAAAAQPPAARRSGAEPTARTGGTGPGGSGAPGRKVTIRLRRMPLLLHEAWREHAETLLRESLLASLDQDAGDGADPILVHAAATDAVSLLEEQVPAAAVDLRPDRLIVDAAEPLVSAEEVRLQVPDASLPHFTVLERALDRALEMAVEGRVMAPVTQPEVEAFRRWVCDQVRKQADGGAPEPWSVRGEAPVAPLPLPDWDAGAVRASTEAMMAADDANRILAVSAAAVQLLGYDDAAELEGERLVGVVPERLRQAHVAGFTLHLLGGRAPLLGHPIDVPARRRDGSEVPVRIELSVQRSADDRKVFVARLHPRRVR